MARVQFALPTGVILAALLACWCVAVDAKAQDAQGDAAMGPAATQQSDASTGEMHVQQFGTLPYAFVSGQTTLAGMAQTVPQLMAQLEQAITAGVVQSGGPVVFVYHGLSGDPTQQFQLDVGLLTVPEGQHAGLQVAELEPFSAATILYTGPVTDVQAAYQKLFTQISESQLAPTGVVREFYLYWEGPESLNNVVQIQAGLQAEAPAGQ